MGLVTLTFELETGMQVASEVGNLRSKFGHARLLGSRIIRYVHDGQMETVGQKQRITSNNIINSKLGVMKVRIALTIT